MRNLTRALLLGSIIFTGLCCFQQGTFMPFLGFFCLIGMYVEVEKRWEDSDISFQNMKDAIRELQANAPCHTRYIESMEKKLTDQTNSLSEKIEAHEKKIGTLTNVLRIQQL